jgi:16S rRNA (uracil1498-N3)-methyltransferase
MALQRFFGEFDFSKKAVKIADTGQLNQLQNVLRLKAGDEVILCDGRGNEALAEIADLDESHALLFVKKITANDRELPRRITLFCSVLKKENFEWVVQKAAEVGIARIVPIVTERTVKLGLPDDRLQKIAQEAAEQSGRGVVPEITAITDLGGALNGAIGTNLMFDVSGENLNPQALKNVKEISIWIGPEGGWTENELAAAKAKNFIIVNLGKLTLRAETAAVVGAYLAGHID